MTRRRPLVTEQDLEQAVTQARGFYEGPGGQVNATHMAIVYASWLFFQESRQLSYLTKVLLAFTLVLITLTCVLVVYTYRLLLHP